MTRAPGTAALLVSAAFAASGCGLVAPSAVPTVEPTSSPRPPTEVYAEIRGAVERTRGLQASSAVDPVTIDEAQLRANLEAEFDAEYAPEELGATEDTLIALGLLPPGSSLRQLTLDLQAGQVAGYYSPDRDQLFVVQRSGDALGAVERVTYAHEFTHQLQDQRFDLDGYFDGAGGLTDGSLGRLAVIEGDAVSVQSVWMTDNLTPREMGELIAVALGPTSLEALRRAPRYLRETSLFPYEDGFAFVSRLLANGGYDAVNAAYDDPPDSTEQILHPDRYLEREPPVAVALPGGIAGTLGPGWADGGQDTLGELMLRIWLSEGTIPAAESRAAAAGWGGDRVILLRGPDDVVAVGLVTVWDTPADAAEFAAAATLALAALGVDGTLRHGEGSLRVAIAFGERAGDLVTALGE